MGWILTQCSIGHTSGWFPSSSDIKLQRVTNAQHTWWIYVIENCGDSQWVAHVCPHQVLHSTLWQEPHRMIHHQTVLYDNIPMLRISYRLRWQWVWILSPNHPFAGICSSFSAVNFVRLLQLVPSGTFGCFGNVTDRVRHTLYKCYGPCTPYTV